VKSIKCLAVAIWPLVIMLVGCYLRRPTLQASYVDQGGTMVWSATGRPFQIYWSENDSPCLASDSLKSDGKSDVVCHAFAAGSYQYYVDAPSNPKRRETKAPPVLFMMHVGTCTGCSIEFSKKNSPQIADNGASPSGGEVDISCSATGVPTTFKPSGGPTGLKVGSDVLFYFKGTYISGTTPMTLTFAAADCANNPKPGQDFIIQGNAGHCQVKNSPTISYRATANLCSESQGTLSVSASQ
jgi:hypothetical protein